MKATRALMHHSKSIPAGPIFGLLLTTGLLTSCGDEPSSFVERQMPDYQGRESDLDSLPSDSFDSSDALAEQSASTNQDVVILDSSQGQRPDNLDNDPNFPGRDYDPNDDSASRPDSLEQLQENKARLPKFGLLVNDLECGLCHVTVLGNIASTRRVPPLWADSDVKVTGSWWVADTFDGDIRMNVKVETLGGVKQDYVGPELPIDRTGNGQPDFPVINFAALPQKMRGNLQAALPQAVAVSKVHSGNLVLIGSEQAPIAIHQDILVDGDLVIKGVYTGTGTIYVRGNIYIPADLRAKRSAFPYPEQEAAAHTLAEQQMQAGNTDALGLATAKSIFIADLEKHQNTYSDLVGQTVYNFHATPVNRRAEALGVYQIYDWFPGGRTEYNKLYERALNCNNQATQIASFNLVEAFLYAQNTLAGISRQSSYSIRGGVIADYFHLVSGASLCSAQSISAAHGKAGNRSYIEYDYRIMTGQLGVLEYIGAQFPKN